MAINPPIGTEFARRMKRRNPGFGDTCPLDKVFVKISGKRHYLWRAVDQDGEVIDVYLKRRDANNLFNLHRHFLSRRFFKLLLIRTFAIWMQSQLLKRELALGRIRTAGLNCQHPFQP